MRIVQNIVIGGLVIFVGFAFYPSYIEKIYIPLYNLAKTLFPSMSIEQELFWQIFPYVILFAIIGSGLMWFMGKKSLLGKSDETESKGE